MKDFSPNYLDKLATRLEEMSGDPRSFGEDADSRILTSLETMGNIATPNGDYQQRVCDAVNNINIGGGGGGANLGIGNFNANGIYNASDFDLDGFNKAIVNVPDGPATVSALNYSEFMYDLNDCTNFRCCFNAPIELSNGITNCQDFFSGFYNFNQPVTIPNGVTTCMSMFDYCLVLNQPVTIPNSVTSCMAMFSLCLNFNQPVEIPDSVTDCSYMFRFCTNFNQPVNVPNNVSSVESMFDDCSNMNSLVRLPESLNNGKTTAFWNSCSVSVANGTLEFY